MRFENHRRYIEACAQAIGGMRRRSGRRLSWRLEWRKIESLPFSSYTWSAVCSLKASGIFIWYFKVFETYIRLPYIRSAALQLLYPGPLESWALYRMHPTRCALALSKNRRVSGRGGRARVGLIPMSRNITRHGTATATASVPAPNGGQRICWAGDFTESWLHYGIGFHCTMRCETLPTFQLLNNVASVYH